MMLFVFVLMLVGVDISDSFVETIRGQRYLGVLFGLGLLAVLAGAVMRTNFAQVAGIPQDDGTTNPGAVADLLFSDYPFTLEVTGCLLIIAAVGAVVLTHRVRLTKRIGQAEIVSSRLRRGLRLTPPPAPGNYARHNAADIPALDASGQLIEDSVPSVLRMRGQVHRLTGVAQDLLPAVEAEASNSTPDVVPVVTPDAVPPASQVPATSSTDQAQGASQQEAPKESAPQQDTPGQGSAGQGSAGQDAARTDGGRTSSDGEDRP
jgi:NADH-quinone oxidoreductase subunit J